MWLERSASSNIFIDPKVRLGAIYALALGTNFGAFSFSFSSLWLTCSFRRVTTCLRVRTLTVARNSPLARPLIVGPATGGGLAATLSLADKAVGSARIAWISMDEVNIYISPWFITTLLTVTPQVLLW